jgi:hypothetical protein
MRKEKGIARKSITCGGEPSGVLKLPGMKRDALLIYRDGTERPCEAARIPEPDP